MEKLEKGNFYYQGNDNPNPQNSIEKWEFERFVQVLTNLQS
jgi:hypothetical protein